MTAFQSVGEVVLVDDLAAGDIDEDAPRFHRGEAFPVEEPMGLRRPLAANRDEIAVWQVSIEISRATDLAEPRGQGLALPGATPGADDPHPECRAKAAD